MGILNRLFKLYFSDFFKSFKSSRRDSFGNFDEYYRKFNRYWEQFKENGKNAEDESRKEKYEYKNHSYSGRTNEYQKKIAQYYANLEVPYGSNLETVKKSWKKLLLKYHPDKHNDNDERKKTANILTQKLNEAYFAIEKELKKTGA